MLEKAKTVGSQAYQDADYDLGMAHFMLGRVLYRGRQVAPAIDLFVESQRLFEAVGEGGENMASVALGQKGDCLADLGQLDEAAITYEEKIKRAEKSRNYRQVAVGKGQLATLRQLQRKYAEAVAGHKEALTIFQTLNEPKMVATAWHQIGTVLQEVENYEEAEAAYRRSLEIKTQNNDRAAQAISLGQLGNLYLDKLNRPEEAVAFYRQAADIAVELGDLAKEGLRRNNIAEALRILKRYNEAREEIIRAIQCNRPFGHATHPWVSFNILCDIESALGNHAAARAAWVQARDTYLAYRQQGGYTAQGKGGELIDHIIGLISQEKAGDIQLLFNELLNNLKTSESLKQLIQAVITILNGSRDKTVGDDPALSYADAAEVLFLIERLGG